MSYQQQCGHEEEMQELLETERLIKEAEVEIERLTKLAEVVSGMEVFGIPVQYVHHYAMFSAVSGCEDVYVYPKNGVFVFPDGEKYPVMVLDTAVKKLQRDRRANYEQENN